jgi:hypothetical protein
MNAESAAMTRRLAASVPTDSRNAHTELLRMLCDPRLRIEDSHDPIDEKEEKFQTLDKSKQDALREILSTSLRPWSASVSRG